MKQISIFLFAILAFATTGCNNVKEPKTGAFDVKHINGIGYVGKFEYEGHTYLVRSDVHTQGGNGFGYGGLCHDENCKCKTK